MNTLPTMTPIPVLPGQLGGKSTHLVDARRLHDGLGVRRDFSNWIRGRIQDYGFEVDVDYVVNVAEGDVSQGSSVAPDNARGFRQNGRKPMGGRPNIDYFLTLDMAKELAMVERSARGREARRYFIACERQLRQLREGLAAAPAVPARLSRAERQAINRQAWAEVAGAVYQAFHARRELLIQEYAEAKDSEPVLLPQGFRPPWAR